MEEVGEVLGDLESGVGTLAVEQHGDVALGDRATVAPDAIHDLVHGERASVFGVHIVDQIAELFGECRHAHLLPENQQRPR